jgi:flagellar hook-associated protein 2
MTSNKTGLANAMNVTANALSDSLGITAGGALKNPLQTAADAQLTVNGIGGITRSSNQVTDLISGVTLSLLKAEPNTKINLEISNDLNGVKTGLSDFVTAYNDLRTWADDQRTASDRNNDGKVADDEVGVLAYDTNVRQILQQMGQMVGTEIRGNVDGFKSLGQLGINLNQDYKLEVNDAVLDSRLLGNVDAVQSLFAMRVTASDSRLTYLDRGAATQTGTYYVNIAGTNASGNVTSANLRTTAASGNGGANDGTVKVEGSVLTEKKANNADGLKLNFNGGNNAAGVNDIKVTVSRGVADQFYDFFNDLTKVFTGSFDTQIEDMQKQNKAYADRVATMDDRLVNVRTKLERQYNAMEVALSKLNNLKDTLKSFTDSANNN